MQHKVNQADEGKRVMVVGHYLGDFAGTIKYGGPTLAVVTDDDGVDREICYMHPVEFDVQRMR